MYANSFAHALPPEGIFSILPRRYATGGTSQASFGEDLLHSGACAFFYQVVFGAFASLHLSVISKIHFEVLIFQRGYIYICPANIKCPGNQRLRTAFYRLRDGLT